MKSFYEKLRDQVDFVLEGLRKNPLSGSEAMRSSAIGALSAALAGAGIGALTGKKKNRLKRALKGALMGGLAGGVAGPAYAQIRKYLDGIKYDNSKFDAAQHNKGDKVYIGVSGSANGEGASWFADAMRAKFGDNAYMLRHVDRKKLKEMYKDLTEKGLDVTLVGHSSGGASVGKFLRDNPEAKGYLIDPVSWLGNGVPDNAVVFTVDKSTRHGGKSENTIADIGGRWNYEGKNSVLFRGSHSDMIPEIIRDFISKGVKPGDKLDAVPSYVTSVFGKSAETNQVPKSLIKGPKSGGRIWASYDPRHPMGGPSARRTYSKVDDFGIKPHTLEEEAESKRLVEAIRDGVIKDTDQGYYNILVGGANAGGKGFQGLSSLPFGVLARGKNRKLFRNGQIKEIRQEIEKALAEYKKAVQRGEKGRLVRVVGHSWGGADVARLAKDYPGVHFIAADPVSWTGVIDSVPKNLTILRPTSSKNLLSIGGWAQLLGHQWPRIGKGEGEEIVYEGDHVNGISDWLSFFNDAMIRRRTAN